MARKYKRVFICNLLDGYKVYRTNKPFTSMALDYGMAQYVIVDASTRQDVMMIEIYIMTAQRQNEKIKHHSYTDKTIDKKEEDKIITEFLYQQFIKRLPPLKARYRKRKILTLLKRR